MNSIRILLADDHPLFREGVAKTLEDQGDFVVIGQADNTEQAIAMAADQLPDLALLDISMPGSGLEAARQIALRVPVVKVVMLTVSEHDDDVMQALKIGARGYVLKGVGGDQLADVLRSIQRGDAYVSPSLAARLLTELQPRAEPMTETHPLDQLTAREEQILKHVAQGLSNREVGDALQLQEKTVKHYMTNILQKLQVRNRVEAALLARERLDVDGRR